MVGIRLRQAAAVALVGATLAGGCGDDGDATAAEPTTTEAEEAEERDTEDGGEAPDDDAAADDGHGATRAVVLDETFADDSNGWGTEDGAEVSVRFRNGYFVMEIKQDIDSFVEYYPDALVEPATAGELADVEVEAVLHAGAGSAAVVTCYSSTDMSVPAGGSGYYFFVTPLGRAGIYRMHADRAPDQLAKADSLGFELSEQTPATLTAECTPGAGGSLDLRLSVNGEPMLDASDPAPPPPGLVAVAVGGDSVATEAAGGFQPLVVAVDSFVVSAR